MKNNLCPVLLAGVLAFGFNEEEQLQNAQCIGSNCAWWDSKYQLCFVEMIALRS